MLDQLSYHKLLKNCPRRSKLGRSVDSSAIRAILFHAKDKAFLYRMIRVFVLAVECVSSIREVTDQASVAALDTPFTSACANNCLDCALKEARAKFRSRPLQFIFLRECTLVCSAVGRTDNCVFGRYLLAYQGTNWTLSPRQTATEYFPPRISVQCPLLPSCPRPFLAHFPYFEKIK
jgi:hypothetical protein